MKLRNKLMPYQAFQMKAKADLITETINSMTDHETLQNLIKKVYPDYPEATHGSRKFLMNELTFAMDHGDIEIALELRKAVAKTVSITGNNFLNKTSDGENMYGLLQLFLWWSEILRDFDWIIEPKSAKRAA